MARCLSAWGPGAAAVGVDPLDERLPKHRRLIRYDQLGCGRSDRPDDLSLWTVARYVEELELVVRALELDSFHLLGHSWGGMLAMSYVLAKKQKPTSLILSSAPGSVRLWQEDAAEMRRALSAQVQAVLGRHEAAGTTDSDEYELAMMEYYKRHVCRLDPWPESLTRSFDQMNRQIYNHMWGPSEFTCLGTLRDFELLERLHSIDIPTLVISGEHDECTPRHSRFVAGSIPRAELHIVPGASHSALFECPDDYLSVIEAFLDRVEGARVGS